MSSDQCELERAKRCGKPQLLDRLSSRRLDRRHGAASIEFSPLLMAQIPQHLEIMFKPQIKSWSPPLGNKETEAVKG